MRNTLLVRRERSYLRSVVCGSPAYEAWHASLTSSGQIRRLRRETRPPAPEGGPKGAPYQAFRHKTAPGDTVSTITVGAFVRSFR